MKLPRPERAALAAACESVMRGLARVVTDRRWAAPLSAMALCFGLFLGVAIGPAVSGSVAGPAAQIVALPVGGSAADPEPAEPPTTAAGGEHEEEPGEAESFAGAPYEEAFLPEEPIPGPGPQPQESAPPPAEPEAEEEAGEAVALKGTVVRVNSGAGSYTLASPSGELVSVHAPKLPPAGTRLALAATPLPNNTFAEQSREKAGAATAASFSGTVTYVDPDPLDPAYTVSGRGSSLLVHADPANLAELPALGAYAKVGVRIEKRPPAAAPETLPAEPPLPPPPPPVDPAPVEPPACVPDPELKPGPAPASILVQRTLTVEAAAPASYLDLAGVLTALCPDSGQILISADDLREGEADLLLAVPTKIRTTALELGDPLLATAELAEDGTLTLAGLASDDGLEGAEETREAQGDLAR